MPFTQKTFIKNVNPMDVVRCFHSNKFIEFFTENSKYHNGQNHDENRIEV